MELAVWLLACVVVSIALLQRPVVLLLIALCGYVFVPYAATAEYVHFPTRPALHPATWLLLTYLLCITLTHRANSAQTNPADRFSTVQMRLPVFALVPLILGSIIIAIQAYSSHDSGFSIFLNQLLVPLSAIPILRRAILLDSRAPQRLARVIVYVGMLEAAIVLLIKTHLIPQPYNHAYGLAYIWYPPSGRAIGTTDHPEVLGLILMGCLALVLNLPTVRRQLLAFLLLFAALLLTAERIPILFALIIILTMFLRRSTASRRAKLSIALSAFLLFLIGVWTNTFSLLLSRISYDGGSTLGRTIAWHNGLALVPHYPLTGIGLTATGTLTYQQTSYESAGIIFGIAFGLIPVAMFFFGEAYSILGGMRNKAVIGSSIGAIAVLIYEQLFSSLNTESAVGPFGGFLMALAICYIVEEAVHATREAPKLNFYLPSNSHERAPLDSLRAVEIRSRSSAP